MKKILLLPILFALTACTTTTNESNTNYSPTKTSIQDFKPLSDKQWRGTLSYLDYSGNGKRYTIPAKAEILLSPPNSVLYAIAFPDEPHMNSENKLEISANGTQLDGAAISKRLLNSDYSLELITESLGQDNGQAATIRTTYIISDDNFVIRKDFKLSESSVFINRNEFIFAVE